MTSEKKIAANRKNAQRSTGPKTAEGKAKSSKNALKHGILSMEAFLEGDDPDEINELFSTTGRHFRPVGIIEEILVDRIISLIWRLRRALAVENRAFQEHRMEWCTKEDENGKQRSIQVDRGPAHSFIWNARRGSDIFRKIGRYETTLDRLFFRTLHELQRLQAARLKGNGDGTKPPIAKEADASVAG